VYPASNWYEKQDDIRSLQKNSKDPAPEFYNINLERPKGDAVGYDLVVVDPMHKANYASRICHSCQPNCETKVTAVDGYYQIGIYTVRPIGFGEEVTFNYNSITE
ncbi:Histone-lysine N-methyltransferase atxr3, partial [Dionaea muscipula]